MKQPSLSGFDDTPLEAKKDVFYVRCRPLVKKMLLFRMQQDGFTSMSDWFDQFVLKNIILRKTKYKKQRGRA
jgi:hypothetical protein